MSTLREAAEQARTALNWAADHIPPQGDPCQCPVCVALVALEAALAQEEATGKESLQDVKESLMVTTTDRAWLETRRLVRIWKELGQMRWVGVDEGWDRAIEAVRARLDKECQDVLAWKEKVEASGQTAAQLLQKLRGMKDD